MTPFGEWKNPYWAIVALTVALLPMIVWHLVVVVIETFIEIIEVVAEDYSELWRKRKVKP